MISGLPYEYLFSHEGKFIDLLCLSLLKGYEFVR